MAQDEEDKFVDSLVIRDLTGDSGEFGTDDIEFIRRNPEVLTKLADPLEVKKRLLYALFVIAVVMAVVSKILEYTGVLEGHSVANDLLTDVMFSISIELFGAATVAFLLELVFEKRIQRNQALVKLLMSDGQERGDDRK